MGSRPISLPTLNKPAKRLIIIGVVLVALVFAWFQFVKYFVDYVWFSEIGFSKVFVTTLVTRIVLFVAAAVLTAVAVFGALTMAYRSRPVFMPSSTQPDPLAPYRTLITARPKLIGSLLAAVVGIAVGVIAQGYWSTALLLINGGSFGKKDPQFGLDIGFYVFQLPAINALMSWLFLLVAICFIVVLVVQYLFSGIRLQGKGSKITRAATMQLSLLVGVFVLVKAVQYWFDRYGLLYSRRGGPFYGASYTDIHAVLPAKTIMMVIAGICAIGFIVGAFLRTIKVPVIALALVVLSNVLLGGLWPMLMQNFKVKPNPLTSEPEYISRSIEATRDAYDIGPDKVTYVDYEDRAGDPKELAKDRSTIPNARLLDPNLLSATFTYRQQLENFYGFPDQLAVDRYTVDGKVQDYIVAARELDNNKLAANQRDWVNQHVVYTHGNGFVAAPANQVTDGFPKFTVSDLGNQGKIPVDQPRIYYGEMASNYAIVGKSNGGADREYDTQGARYTYSGAGGVPVGSFFEKMIFATHYSEIKFLFADDINSSSKILYNRQPRERVQKAAPFLTVDTKAYPAVVNKRIVWIVDAYTTAQGYPYSEDTSLAAATKNSLQARGAARQVDTQVSYIRNSVKATVDAYDGTVTLYRMDQGKDPVLSAWDSVFPGLLTPENQVSDELRSHFRYPQDLFEVQRAMLAKYHVNDPVTFFNTSDFWKVPSDPTEAGTDDSQPPYYLQVRLPGQTDSRFELTTALSGFERDFIAAYVTANSDPDNYGTFNVLKFPTTTQTPGPKLVQQLFNADAKIAGWVTLRSTAGKSEVLYGNLLTLPIDNGLLYVEPLYVKGASTSSYPQLGQVLVWYSNRVGMGETLAQALADAATKSAVTVADGPGSNDGQPTSPVSSPADGATPLSTAEGSGPAPTTGISAPSSTVTPPADQAAAIAAMDTALKELDAAKSSGDLARIGEASKKLEESVNQYLKLNGTSLSAISLAPTTSGG